MASLLRQCRQGESFAGQFGGRLSATGYDKVVRYGKPVGSTIETHTRLPRCMDRLKEMIDGRGRQQEPLPNGTVVMAEELASGSGRFDRQWFAPPGGLWMAMAWADTLLPDFARLLPLAAGSACCEAVRFFGVNAALKWVNDLHVNGRKLGGILCETYAGGNGADRYHLIGIGINCNNLQFPADLRHSACSMREVLGRPVDLVHFAMVLLTHLSWHVGLVHLLEEQDLECLDSEGAVRAPNPVVDAWREMSDTPGRKVIYGYDVVRSPLYTARVLDIDREGGLVLQIEDGSVVTETSGEILYLPGDGGK